MFEFDEPAMQCFRGFREQLTDANRKVKDWQIRDEMQSRASSPTQQRAPSTYRIAACAFLRKTFNVQLTKQTEDV